MHPAIRLVIAASVLLLPAAARADVAPPPDYVDPCKTAELDDSCERCISPEFKSPACHERARAAGKTVRCQGWSYAMYCGGEPAPSVEALAEASPAEAPPPTQPADKDPAADVTADKDPSVEAAAAAPATASAPSAPQESPPQESAPQTAEGGRCALADDRPVPVGALALLLVLARRRRQT
jgi:hypothetical protein